MCVVGEESVEACSPNDLKNLILLPVLPGRCTRSPSVRKIGTLGGGTEEIFNVSEWICRAFFQIPAALFVVLLGPFRRRGS